MLLVILLMIWLTTVRHESAHWIAAVLQDVEVSEVRLLPGIHPELGFYFGYVARGDGGTWLIDAAPFFAAMVWFTAAWLLLRRLEPDSKLRLPVLFIGCVSPLIDLAYNYQGGFWREGTDVHDLFEALPDVLVHGYFLLAMGLCVIGLRAVRPPPPST